MFICTRSAWVVTWNRTFVELLVTNVGKCKHDKRHLFENIAETVSAILPYKCNFKTANNSSTHVFCKGGVALLLKFLRRSYYWGSTDGLITKFLYVVLLLKFHSWPIC